MFVALNDYGNSVNDEDHPQQEQIDPQGGPQGGGRRPSFPVTTPTASSGHPTITRRPFQLVNHPDSPFNAVTNPEQSGGGWSTLTAGKQKPNHTTTLNSSTQESSDFERCSLDYEPGSSAEYDQHSSEEELSVIAGQGVMAAAATTTAEKRKWSQIHRCSSCSDACGSSDEEVCDLLACPSQPVAFSASPPKDVHKLSRTMSPHLFFSGMSAGAVRVCAVSPRKRHRHSDNDTSTVIHRPCLDFEKMQVWKFQLSTCLHWV